MQNNVILNMSGKPLTDELRALGVIDCPQAVTDLINKELDFSSHFEIELSDKDLYTRCLNIFNTIYVDEDNEHNVEAVELINNFNITMVYLDPQAFQANELIAAAEDANFEPLLPVRKDGVIVGLV